MCKIRIILYLSFCAVLANIYDILGQLLVCSMIAVIFIRS